MELNNKKNLVLQILLKEKGMNDFAPLKNTPAYDAWAYIDNNNNLCICDRKLKSIPVNKLTYNSELATLIYFDGESYNGLGSNKDVAEPDKIKRLFLVILAPLKGGDSIKEIDTSLRLYSIHNLCYYLAIESGIKAHLFDTSNYYILSANETFISHTMFLLQDSCLSTFFDKDIHYWGSTHFFYCYNFFFSNQTKEWIVVCENRVVMTSASDLILFFISKYKRIAVINYPCRLTNIENYTTVQIPFQCLVNKLCSCVLDYVPVFFSKSKYDDSYSDNFNDITSSISHFFAFDESITFVIEYSERLYEDEYSCKKQLLITYFFENDKNSILITTHISSINISALPSEVTTDFIFFFMQNKKAVFDRQTGKMICEALSSANYGITCHNGIYDFINKKILLDSVYTEIMETKAFHFTAFIITANNLRNGVAHLEYGITTPENLLLPPIYSRFSNIDYKPKDKSFTMSMQCSHGPINNLKAPFIIEDSMQHKLGLMNADGSIIEPQYDKIYYAGSIFEQQKVIIFGNGNKLYGYISAYPNPFPISTDNIKIENSFLVYDDKYIALCDSPNKILKYNGFPIIVQHIVNDDIFVSNNKIFQMKEGHPEIIYGNDKNIIFCDGNCTLCLFVKSEHKGSYNPGNYICIELMSSGDFKYIPLCHFSEEYIELNYNQKIKEGHYICCGDYFFDIDDSMLLSQEDIIEEADDNTKYDYDDIDWDRETYYALGGDDYDAIKRNGGNIESIIDDMMDEMGF